MEDVELIRRWIRWKEEQAGREYPYKELATDANLDRSFLSQVMNGHRGIGKGTLTKLACAFGVSLVEFLSGPQKKEQIKENNPSIISNEEKTRDDIAMDALIFREIIEAIVNLKDKELLDLHNYIRFLEQRGEQKLPSSLSKVS